ncbi:MAG: hypothetical protein J6R59_09995 [Paludibacteraceae bacterium]|nr:hypothetical protein [Paludibacteraceae bacterium]
MNVMQVFCGNCAGTGKMTNWKVVDSNDNMGTMKREETVCCACNGKGYTEYATFTLEEAKAILKHCGLSTES